MRDIGRKPALKLTCCLCSRVIAQRADVYPLDDEWARRYPAMRGKLACHRCALESNDWECKLPDGSYVPGHIPMRTNGVDIDSWSHVGPPCTHVAAVLRDPDSAMIQGGSDYLRWTATRRREIAEFLAAYDGTHHGA